MMKPEIKGTYTFEKRRIGKDRIPTLLFSHEREEPQRAVICLHGWTGNKESMLTHCLKMADAGFLSISIDARMHGERLDPEFWRKFGENFPRTFFSVVTNTAKDIIQVVDYLEARFGTCTGRIGLMGVSMGGFITLVAATLEKRLEAVASVIGTANFPLFIERMLSLKVFPFKEKPMSSPDEETRNLFESFDPMKRLSTIPPTAVLLIGGLQDPFIPKEGITQLYDALKPYYDDCPDRLKMHLYNVGHAYTAEMESEVIQWFDKHLHVSNPSDYDNGFG